MRAYLNKREAGMILVCRIREFLVITDSLRMSCRMKRKEGENSGEKTIGRSECRMKER